MVCMPIHYHGRHPGCGGGWGRLGGTFIRWGTAGGGTGRAVVSGAGELLDLTIDPSVIDPADPAETAATVADLVLAAVRDAWDSAVDLQQRQLGALGGLGGGFGGPPAGFDLSSLGLPSLGGQPGLEYDE